MRIHIVTRFATFLAALTAASLFVSAGSSDTFLHPRGETPPPPPIGDRENAYIDKALAAIKMTRADLGFKKDLADDPYRLNVVQDLMDHPLKTIDVTHQMGVNARMAGDDICALLKMQGDMTDAAPEAAEYDRMEKALAGAPTDKAVARYVESLRGFYYLHDGLAILLKGTQMSQEYLKAAFARLAPDEVNSILLYMPTMWYDQEDLGPTAAKVYARSLLHRYGMSDAKIDKVKDLPAADFLKVCEKVDRRQLFYAGYAAQAAVQAALPYLTDENAPKGAHPIRYHNPLVTGDVLFAKNTPWGEVVVGGTDANTYKFSDTPRGAHPGKPFFHPAILVDLGGDDIYQGPVATGSAPFGYPTSLNIDVSGNDVYAAGGDFSQACGVMGVGIIAHWKGDASYTAGKYAQGCGMLGTGVLFDHLGVTTYSADLSAQGAATLGYGVLRDSTGNDYYLGRRYVQGFGSVYAFGLLSDGGGNDLYYAGGKYLHAPLYPDQFQSLSQGFGFGWRGTSSGGIGMLYDRSGNDSYNTEIYGQGSSYWYALGVLIDDEGNDAYTSVHYSQGAGIHLSVGMLLDRAGKDSYQCHYGPSQGAAHDLAVGILIDCEGEDFYSSNGIGQGNGHADGFGLFVDKDGHDLVGGRYPWATQGSGDAGMERGYGSIGIYLNLGPDNVYSAGDSKPGTLWTKGYWGVGIDTGDEPLPPTPK